MNIDTVVNNLVDDKMKDKCMEFDLMYLSSYFLLVTDKKCVPLKSPLRHNNPLQARLVNYIDVKIEGSKEVTTYIPDCG